MIALIWQTALLLLGAYFLGAFLACVVRRTFSALAPRPQPVTVPPGTNEAAARFERALTGQGTATAAAATATTAAAATAGPDHSAALLSAARSIGTAARRSAPRPIPSGNAEAAAALSAAAATAERRQPGPPETGLAVALPASSGTTGPSAVAAQVSMPSPRAQVPKVAAAADDLTRIRGIDAAMQARLDAQGIRSFAQIAAWRAEDVERIGAEFDVRERISQQNWIEQAQVLAGGGETFYLKSRARPEPEAGTRVALPIAAATAAAAAAAAAPGASDNLQRIAGIDRDLERRLNAEGVDRYRQIAAWSADDVTRFDRLLRSEGRIAAEYWVEQARVLSSGGETAFSRAFDRMGGALPRQAPPAGAGGPAAATDREAARQGRSDISVLRSVRSEAYRAAEGSPADTGAIRSTDDLKRIRGIGLLIEKRLNAMGISRYEQIAHWTAEDVERVSGKLDFKGRIERENWIEQARILASGGQTEFSRRIDRGEVEKRG
jgi:predicted flap endonuclease-1-like 5' DNA nuclease